MQPDGCTLREHLESLARQRARAGLPPPEGLADFVCPPAAEYVWQWYCEISRRRGGNGFSANPISYTDVESWARLTRTTPSGLDVEWIMDLDDARAMASAGETSATPTSAKTKK